MFSCEFCETFKNIFFDETPSVTASTDDVALVYFLLHIQLINLVYCCFEDRRLGCSYRVSDYLIFEVAAAHCCNF